ncbi:hypothetical protein BDN72DRAFT_896480 [Pluteus cervinus]|uniref:Uncharacterized protein n=1 Tax=Pluteus cervinus TaxID=181527 RepID=A0ACD3AXA4_9AGAR|nr:hypothetical protein BDN72DRAFT_896480 [Pluteus cervinus]
MLAFYPFCFSPFTMMIALSDWRVASTIGLVIAIVSGLYRLTNRTQQKTLWIDDYPAGAALCFSIGSLSSTWMNCGSDGPEATAVFWLTTICFPCVIWLARMAIILSIARVFPDRIYVRIVCYSMTSAFAALWCLLTVQSIFSKDLAMQYHSKSIVLVLEVICDVGILAFPSVLYYWGLPRSQNLFIGIILCFCAASASTGVVYTSFAFNAGEFGFVEASLVSLFKSLQSSAMMLSGNILIIAPWAYRCRYGEDDSDATSSSTKFTTITSDHNQPAANPV